VTIAGESSVITSVFCCGCFGEGGVAAKGGWNATGTSHYPRCESDSLPPWNVFKFCWSCLEFALPFVGFG